MEIKVMQKTILKTKQSIFDYIENQFEDLEAKLLNKTLINRKEKIKTKFDKTVSKTPEKKVSILKKKSVTPNSTMKIKSNKSMPQEKQTKKVNEYLDIILNLDIDKDFQAIQKLLFNEQASQNYNFQLKRMLPFIREIMKRCNSVQNKENKDYIQRQHQQIQLEELYQAQDFESLNKELSKMDQDNKHLNFINVNTKYKNQSLLEISFQNEYKELEEICYQKLQNTFNQKDFFQNCFQNNFDAIYCNLREGVDVNSRYKHGPNGYLISCQNGNKNIVQLFLHYNTDLSCRNSEGYTGFIIACAKGNTEVVDLLVKQNVDIEEEGYNGNTGFILACQNQQEEVIKILLTKGVDIYWTNNINQTGYDYLKPDLKRNIWNFIKTQQLQIKPPSIQQFNFQIQVF